MNKKIVALIPAAGSGSRFGSELPKQYTKLAGKCVLQHTLDIFAKNPRVHKIAVVISPDDVYFDELICLPENGYVLRVGGSSRSESVSNGLNELFHKQLVNNDDVILVHDAARCCLPQTALNRLLDCADVADGAILAIPVADTLKRAINENNQSCIDKTIPREQLWQAQTPQLFQAALLKYALLNVDFHSITDEASAIEQIGRHPLLVQGDTCNIKLTRPDDAALITYLLEQLV